MTLKAGTRLGPFEILEALGAGGMGEVYRARDTKLNRDVAIKLLPESLAGDPERSARFQREAKVVASLNHSNIGGIFGLEESNGLRFLVLELVEGDTLADRLEKGRLLIGDALDFSRQIAEALETAHERGVVHRDLKPANIKITPDNKIKILDFGLAKAFEEESEDDESAAITLEYTQPGIILGTAAYMSPEQARGKAVDKRTDIWAFGCVLFECLTGQRAFEGETTSDTIAKILEREPDFSAIPSATPHNVTRLLRRCLEKDRRRRLRDIGDAHIELEQAITTISGPKELDSGFTLPSRVRRSNLLKLLAVAIVGLVAGAGLRGVIKREGGLISESVPVLRLSMMIPPEPEYSRGAISPNGEVLVFSADDYIASDGTQVREQLYVRRLDDYEARPISGTEGALAPAFSPDGRWIAFFAWDDMSHSSGQIKKVSLEGGPPITIREGGRGAEFATWISQDSLLVVYDRGTSLGKISADGGAIRNVAEIELAAGEGGVAWSEVLPGGEAALLTMLKIGPKGPRTYVDLVSLEDGERKTFMDDAGFPQYSNTGHLVFTRGDALLAVPFDLGSMEITGRVVPVMSGLRASFRGFSSSDYDISKDGHLMYVPGTESFQERKLFLTDRQGDTAPLTRNARSFDGYLRFSPDGERLAMVIIGADGLPLVWTLDVDRGHLRPVSMTGAACYYPVWSPDGNRLAFSQWVSGNQSAIFVVPVDRSGDPEQIFLSSEDEYGLLPMSWSPDGSVLACERRREGRQEGDIWILPLDDPEQLRPLIVSPARESWARFSPDGRWIAYVSNETGRDEVYVQEYLGLDEQAGARWPVSSNGGTRPFWSADGTELFYEDPQERLLSVNVTVDTSFSSSTPGVVLDGKTLGATGSGDRFHVTPDGQGFAFIQKGVDEGEVTQVNLVLNWSEELERRVPAGGNN